jgi:hypothetical protein
MSEQDSKRASTSVRSFSAGRARDDRPLTATSPFDRSHGAVADLCHAFGYPPAVVPTLPPSIVHRLKVPEDNVRIPVPKHKLLPERGRWTEVYRTVNGVDQRRCRGCGLWLPLNKSVFRWRTDRQRNAWHCECRKCENARRREYNLIRAGL